MSTSTKRYLIALTALLVTALITFGTYSTRSYSGILYTQKVPMIIGDWHGMDIPMDERTYDILETRDAFTRVYTNSKGERISLSVVFAHNNRKVAHPPEVCFTGSGWEKVGKDLREVSIGNRTFEFNRLTLQKDERKQIALYLYKAGGKFTPNYYMQQINIAMNSLLHKNSSSALIRVSTLASGNNIKITTERMLEFISDVMPILEKHLA